MLIAVAFKAIGLGPIVFGLTINAAIVLLAVMLITTPVDVSRSDVMREWSHVGSLVLGLLACNRLLVNENDACSGC